MNKYHIYSKRDQPEVLFIPEEKIIVLQETADQLFRPLGKAAGEAALLVDPYSLEEIANAKLRVLEEPELAQELHQKGLERARQFTWEKTARQTIEVYEKVLGEKLL